MVLATRLNMDPKFVPPTNLKKPNWESENEGVHERVNFDDTIWGFDLAGGSYYNTPLRVTKVKDDSRAMKAGIKKGDKLLKINDIPTEQLTLQEAHDIILESGVHIRLNVTAPEDTETTYGFWQDQPELRDDEEEKKRLEAEKKKKRFVFKTNSRWDLQWPWISSARRIYKESNCYLVPSKWEAKYGHKLLPKIEDKPVVLEPINFKGSTASEEMQEVED